MNRIINFAVTSGVSDLVETVELVLISSAKNFLPHTAMLQRTLFVF
jgi:hypothetical protein